jgi:hypothetical protein
MMEKKITEINKGTGAEARVGMRMEVVDDNMMRTRS